MHGLYDIANFAMVPNLMISQVSQTRGNMYKLQKMYSSMILENICSLVELFTLVVKALSLNCFKSILDKFWPNQNNLDNFKAPFLGTGSRSYS